MKNPFEYGAVVGAASFCNRVKELHELARVFENSDRVFLYSERRMGKTSLIKKALESASKDEYLAVYVDLWPTTSESDFAIRLAKAITESTSTVVSKLLGYSKEFFAFLQPSVTLDEEGRPQVVFGVRRHESEVPTLDDVLAAIPKIARKLKRKIIVVLDEFQQIAEYGSDTIEKRLRTEIQHHQGIAYVFAGSKKHLLEEMFLNKRRPLYRSAAHYPLGPIAESDWQPFIEQKFSTQTSESSRIQSRKYANLQGVILSIRNTCATLCGRSLSRGKTSRRTVSSKPSIYCWNAKIRHIPLCGNL